MGRHHDNDDASDVSNANSDVALVVGRDDESLSSVEDDTKLNDNTTPSTTIQSVQTAVSCPSFWGEPESSSALYRAMKELAATERSTSCRLPNPSAAQADVLAHELHARVHTDILPKLGSADQKEKWELATDEQQHEWIASFFLAAQSRGYM